MFWKKAHKKYSHFTSEDDDIKKYLKISSEMQESSYRGLVGHIQDIGHRWVASRTLPGPVLEIGFGAGHHLSFYKGDKNNYFVSEYSKFHVGSDAWKNIRGHGVRCDARSLPFHADIFNTVISSGNLEHIQDLKNVFQEVHRVLVPKGRFLISLPCEGGLFWNMGRELTTRRYFQKKYGINYDKIIAYEHVWDFKGVFKEIKKCRLFLVERQEMFPFRIPVHHLNLISCIQCSAIK